jgi:hypothetical protein
VTASGEIEAQTSDASLAEVRRDIQGPLPDNPDIIGHECLAPESLMKLPHLAAGNLGNLQQSLADLVGGVIQTNLRTSQEMLSVTSHNEFVELQQRFIHDYLATLLRGSLELVDTIQRNAGQTLPRPGQCFEKRPPII